MRDKEHKTWRVIRAAIEDMTGQRTGNSTLPNRYEYVLPHERLELPN